MPCLPKLEPTTDRVRGHFTASAGGNGGFPLREGVAQFDLSKVIMGDPIIDLIGLRGRHGERLRDQTWGTRES